LADISSALSHSNSVRLLLHWHGRSGTQTGRAGSLSSGETQPRKSPPGSLLVARIPLGRAQRTDRRSTDVQFRYRGGSGNILQADVLSAPREPHSYQTLIWVQVFPVPGRPTALSGKSRQASRWAARFFSNSLSNSSYILDFWGQNAANLLQANENAISVRYQKEVVVLRTISNVASVGNTGSHRHRA
jgi:hypothetical protein